MSVSLLCPLFGVLVDIGCHGGWPSTTHQSTTNNQQPANPKADTEATHQVMMCLCRSCVRCLVCWWILDVMAIGLRHQQPTQKRTQERQPKKSKVYTKTALVYKKILLSNTDHRHIQYPPPPNSGHMSDTLNISKMIHCCLLFQVCWWILDVTVVGRHIQYPPPPNSGHMSDT